MSISLNFAAKDAAANGGFNLFSAISKRFSVAMNAIVLGRMIEVLSKFSDAQLEEIGIQRSEIVAHAKTLVEA